MVAITAGRTTISDCANDVKVLFSEWPIADNKRIYDKEMRGFIKKRNLLKSQPSKLDNNSIKCKKNDYQITLTR